jgi:hypothetical protein
MKKIILVFLFYFTLDSAYSQTDITIWDKMKQINTENYEFSVPEKWREMDMTMVGMEHYFEASGLAYPVFIEDNPVIVIIAFVNMKQNNLEEIKTSIEKGYSQNKDRVFPENFTHETEEFILASGEKAYLINTRFYRPSKGLNQSRFDLGVYSDKAKQGYMFTISIQYSDDSYKFESDYLLKDFARKLYSYFSLK